jgi:hypothetical protein
VAIALEIQAGVFVTFDRDQSARSSVWIAHHHSESSLQCYPQELRILSKIFPVLRLLRFLL